VAVKAYPVTAWLAVQAIAACAAGEPIIINPATKYAAVMLMHTLLTIA